MKSEPFEFGRRGIGRVIGRLALAVLGTWWGVASASAQMPDPMLLPSPDPAPPAPTGNMAAPAPGYQGPDVQPGGVPTVLMPGPGHYDVPGVSNWIRRDHFCSCNNPTGCDGEIGYEGYFRAGPSIPIGSGTVLSRNCQVGLTLEAGFHTLFFNPQNTRAWVVDFGIVSSWNSGGAQSPNDEKFTLNVLVPNNATGVFQPAAVTDTIRGINRTFVNAGLGREWFFGGDGTANTPHWRFGVDAGGRYGTMTMNYNLELKHRTDVIGGAYLGTHLDYEYPWYDLILHVGCRVEYAYSWSDILQQQTDMNELNLLFSAGVRF